MIVTIMKCIAKHYEYNNITEYNDSNSNNNIVNHHWGHEVMLTLEKAYPPVVLVSDSLCH